MKQVKEMPTDGQFVAVWESKREIYTAYCYWKDNNLRIYAPATDNHFSDSTNIVWLQERNPIYYIVGLPK